MRASTANSAETTANNLAQLSAFDPLILELTDQVVLTFQASDTSDAPNTATNATTRGKACSAGQPIKINGWRLTLRGSPSTGDSFTIEGVLSNPVLVDPVRQRFSNVGAFFALPQKAMLDGMPLDGGCDALLSSISTQLPSAAWATDTTAQLAISTESARSRVACVNLDEETARLVQLQQSYQAAAKFLQIAQSTLDTLLQAVWADNEDKP